MAGYTRQSIADIVNGLDITAPPLTAEFNQIDAAFNGTTGHAHDGSTGNGPKINLANSVQGYLPAANGGLGGINKIDATVVPAATNDNLQGYVPGSIWINVTTGRVYRCIGNATNAAVWREEVQVLSGNQITPAATNTVDLGTSSVRFKDAYLATANTTGAATVGGNLAVTGTSSLGTTTITGGTINNASVGATTASTVRGTTITATTGFTGSLTGDVAGNITASTGSSTLNNLTVNGTVDVTNARVENVASPTASTDAATKSYVDNAIINNTFTAPKDFNLENRIINGDMNIWQRATVINSLAYGADRWENVFSGGTVFQQRQPFTVGESLGSFQPAFYLRQSVGSQTATTHYARTSQPIEGVRSYAGQTITVLGWAQRSSGAGSMVVEASQFFGIGGSPSSTVTAISPTTVGLTGSWEPFAAVMTIPNITGKTIGTADTDYLEINFWTSAGSTFNDRTNSLGLQTIALHLCGIHIRQGTWSAGDAALYRPRDPGTELALCQRYYFATEISNQSYASAGTQTSATTFSWPVTMRAAPSIATSGGINTNGTPQAPNNITQTSARFSFISTAAGVAGYTGRLVTLDAEL